MPDEIKQVSTGQDYLRCLNIMEAIKSELSQYGFKDFIDVDVFLWFLFENKIPVKERKTKDKLIEISSQNDANAQPRQLWLVSRILNQSPLSPIYSAFSPLL